MACGLITNLFASTAAHAVGDDDDDGDSASSDGDVRKPEGHAGSIDLVRNTLRGITAHSKDEGERGMGRHGATIILGTHQCSTAPLTEREEHNTQEVFFDEGYFPDALEARHSAAKASKHDDPRPAPYAGAMLQPTQVTYQDDSKLLKTWFHKIMHDEAEPPNPKQLYISCCGKTFA